MRNVHYLCSAKLFGRRINEAKNTKVVKMITKPKTLLDQLREMKLNVEEVVMSETFKPGIIRGAVSVLRKEGYDFSVTEKGCINCCKVTKILEP